MSRRRLIVGGMLSATVAGPGFVRAQSAVTVRLVAASDLKFALTKLLVRYQTETGQKVEATYGSSGSFAQQIQQGLQTDLFLSADEGFVDKLAEAGLTRSVTTPAGQSADRGALYAVGRIAIYVPTESPLTLDTALSGLKAQWHQVSKFSIANPEHAPYGRAAREALQQLGLWERVQPKLVLGENISQATQFVATGAAQAGITALSLALAPEVARFGRHLALPANLHAPLRQRMVLLKSATPAAAAFYDYLQSPAARETLRAFGFTV
ncbi:MAG: molybdate ABC transporter substrate-binding protein [Polaromonas sp.]|nr:molybdate ABC transporter substrate-binding protein [Polaromonas sp.]